MSHPRCLPLRGQGRFAGPGNALPVFLKRARIARKRRTVRALRRRIKIAASRAFSAVPPRRARQRLRLPELERETAFPFPLPGQGCRKGCRVGEGGLQGPRSRRKRPGRGLSLLLPMQRDHPHRRGRPAAQGGGKRAAGFWNPAGFTPREGGGSRTRSTGTRQASHREGGGSRTPQPGAFPRGRAAAAPFQALFGRRPSGAPWDSCF